MTIVVLITTKDLDEANNIADKLVEAELIACANILEGVKSVFRWEGKVDKSDEVLMIVKSRENQIKSIVEMVKKHHSYDVPEIIALPIVDGNQDYLDWIKESC